MGSATERAGTPPLSPLKQLLQQPLAAAAAAVARIASVGALAGPAAVLALDVGTPVWVPDVHAPVNGKKPGCAPVCHHT